MLVDNGVKPNQGTFVNVPSACSNRAGFSEGQQIHQMTRHYITPNIAKPSGVMHDSLGLFTLVVVSRTKHAPTLG
ncbi:unnamed protein product [Prunus armeniaca]